MPYLEYADKATADTRSAELWAEARRDGWQEGNVTQYLYGRRERTGDPENDAGLPETGDAFIVVPGNAPRLDGLVIAEFLTLDEYSAIIEVYDAWESSGATYEVDDLRRHGGQLWRCIQAHPAQIDREPGVAISLWTLAAPTGVIPEWVQPTGGHDAYADGALVTHDGYIWESEIDANVWEPGSAGAKSLWTQLKAL